MFDHEKCYWHQEDTEHRTGGCVVYMMSRSCMQSMDSDFLPSFLSFFLSFLSLSPLYHSPIHIIIYPFAAAFIK